MSSKKQQEQVIKYANSEIQRIESELKAITRDYEAESEAVGVDPDGDPSNAYSLRYRVVTHPSYWSEKKLRDNKLERYQQMLRKLEKGGSLNKAEADLYQEISQEIEQVLKYAKSKIPNLESELAAKEKAFFADAKYYGVGDPWEDSGYIDSSTFVNEVRPNYNRESNRIEQEIKDYKEILQAVERGRSLNEDADRYEKVLAKVRPAEPAAKKDVQAQNTPMSKKDRHLSLPLRRQGRGT